MAPVQAKAEWHEVKRKPFDTKKMASAAKFGADGDYLYYNGGWKAITKSHPVTKRTYVCCQNCKPFKGNSLCKTRAIRLKPAATTAPDS